jgi:hypothetical protein
MYEDKKQLRSRSRWKPVRKYTNSNNSQLFLLISRKPQDIHRTLALFLYTNFVVCSKYKDEITYNDLFHSHLWCYWKEEK